MEKEDLSLKSFLCLFLWKGSILSLPLSFSLVAPVGLKKKKKLQQETIFILLTSLRCWLKKSLYLLFKDISPMGDGKTFFFFFQWLYTLWHHAVHKGQVIFTML